MLPIMVMVGLGIFKMDWALATIPTDLGSVDWTSFIQIMFWTSTYWQKVRVSGGTLRNAFSSIKGESMEASVVNNIVKNTQALLWFELCDGWAYVFGKRTWDKLGCLSAARHGDFLDKRSFLKIGCMPVSPLRRISLCVE